MMQEYPPEGINFSFLIQEKALIYSVREEIYCPLQNIGKSHTGICSAQETFQISA